MKVNGLGGYKNINQYVENKIKRMEAREKNFQTLFELMFSERNNVMYEYSAGYRVVKKTYGEVSNEILRLTAGLRERVASLPHNSIVGLYMDNSLLWLELFWAILLSGHRPLLMNLRLPDGALEQVLTENGVSLVISDGKRFSPETVKAADLLPAEGKTEGLDCGTEVLVMSSGTSQHIKVCAYRAEEFYYQICGSLDIIRKCPQMKAHYEGNLKLLTFLPFYHVFGLIAVYIWFAFFSRTFVQLNDMSPETILNTIKRHQVTHIFAVPLFWETVYSRALDTIKGRGEATYCKYQKGAGLAEALHDIPLLGKAFSKAAFREVRSNLFGESVQFLISGGSNISRETLAFFNNIGYRLANGYGMTEVGITSVELSGRKQYLYNAYVGEPIKYIEYKLSDEGALFVRGKAAAHYIIQDGIRTPNEDWYDTGDVAECKNGHYALVSRRDDLVISSGGENINPFLIETAFSALDGISEACLMKSETEQGVKPVLLLRLKNSIDKTRAEALNAAILSAVNDSRFPKDGRIAFTKEPLMKPDEFKLNRKRISRDYDGGRISLVDLNRLQAEEDTADTGLTELRAFCAKILNKEEAELGYDEDFFLTLGLTSLEYFSLLSAVNEQYGVNVLQGEAADCRNLRQLWAKVKEQDGHVGSHI